MHAFACLALASLSPGDPFLVSQEAYLTASAARGHDLMGASVALSGDYAIAGAPQAQQGTAYYGGAAHVFERVGGSWLGVASIVSASPATYDYLGLAVAAEGDEVFVGVPGEDWPIGQDAGAVLVHRRVAGTWTLAQTLMAPDGHGGDGFGKALAVDGLTLLVGAPNDDAPVQGADAGSAYVFSRATGAWTFQAKLTPSDVLEKVEFGWSVAVVGGTAVIGAPYDDLSGSVWLDIGSAYVFESSPPGWSQTAKLTHYAALPGQRFGSRVSVGGEHLAVTHVGVGGSVHVFRESAGAWSLDAEVVPVGAYAGPTQLSKDLLVVGGISLSGAASGKVIVYRRIPEGWVDVQEFQPDQAPGFDDFAGSIQLDGERLIVGAREDDHGGTLSNAGAAYVFRLEGQTQITCSGDGSTGACPCGNAGSAASGCKNSTGLGGRLLYTGSTSFASQGDLFLAGQMPAIVPALLFHGAKGNAAAIPLGDGLLCVGGIIVRYGAQITSPGGGASWGPGLASPGGWSPGQTLFFQVWYRDPQGSPCGGTFNLTNGVSLTLGP